ncbi:acetoacetate decarboxylase [Fructilactobacillus fructivorans]|uniref:acetoacetate decarboxylase n=1 Tax=Fructilactobacillus fructivorans TaxID=1614 RepID=UPI00070517AA|nr:acetoacetate decarboxylase [Fructilactobacillus fructivorans]KRN42474.1 acetoacetate decarboxylase [Fructilactobacillus fructivorans]
MKKEELLKKITTPINDPAFPETKVSYINREFVCFRYKTDGDTLKKILPEPLKPRGNQVKFEFIKMPDATGRGSYTEACQIIPCTFKGKMGEFTLAMYVDNFPSIASGRETAAFPKKLGKPRVYIDGTETLAATLDYGSLRVAQGTMGYRYQPMDLMTAEDELTQPNYRLNIMRDYDGSPRIVELTESMITNLNVKDAWTSPARLQLFEHVHAPVADLPVREMVGGSDIIADLTLPQPKKIYDYLS